MLNNRLLPMLASMDDGQFGEGIVVIEYGRFLGELEVVCTYQATVFAKNSFDGSVEAVPSYQTTVAVP